MGRRCRRFGEASPVGGKPDLHGPGDIAGDALGPEVDHLADWDAILDPLWMSIARVPGEDLGTRKVPVAGVHVSCRIPDQEQIHLPDRGLRLPAGDVCVCSGIPSRKTRPEPVAVGAHIERPGLKKLRLRRRGRRRRGWPGGAGWQPVAVGEGQYGRHQEDRETDRPLDRGHGGLLGQKTRYFTCRLLPAAFRRLRSSTNYGEAVKRCRISGVNDLLEV